MAWQLSAAQFNMGITLAYLFADTKIFKEQMHKSILTVIAQLVGVALAMFATRGVVLITEYGDDGSSVMERPMVNPMPNVIKPNNSSGLIKQDVFSQEFICSTLFYVAWIIIRNFQMTQQGRFSSISGLGESKNSNILNLTKPFFIAISWAASRHLFFTVNGLAICNPTITLSVLFTDLLVFKPLKWR